MSLTKIGSIGINTGIQLAGVTTVSTLHVGSGVTLSSDGDVFATGISTFSEDIKVGSGITLSPDGDGFYTGVVTATTFSGALAASNLTGALPAISGANLTNLDASDLASGTVPTARLGSGTASSSTFLRGDSTFAAVTSTTINSNADNRVITGSGTADTLNAESNVNINGGILIAGHTVSTTVSNGEGPFIQVKSTDSRGGISLMRHSADAASGGVYIGKSRNATIGSNTIVQDDDELGRITFSGDDGTNVNSEGAAIKCHVDGTPGENDMPGRLQFYTTADGNALPTERLRITSSGQVFIGESVTSSYDAVLLRNTNGNTVAQIVNTNTGSSVQSILQLQVGSDRYVNFATNYAGQYLQTQGVNITTSYNDFDTHIFRANNGTEKVRITSSGQVNIGGDFAQTSYAIQAKTTGTATGLARFENTGGAADGIEVSLYHNTASPADGDQTGYLQFTGNDSSGNGTIYNAIIGYTSDVTDGTEDGDLRFFCRDNATFSQKLNIASDGTFTGSSSNDISDQRLKDNIATVVDPITKIKALKGRTFTWKPEAKLPAGTKYGFIAQEVETVVSDLVDDKHGIRQFDKDGNLIPEDENGKINTDEGTTDSKSVNAIGVVPILVEALKETLVKIETLETKVAALEG